jgi:predicted transcriptional regulator
MDRRSKGGIVRNILDVCNIEHGVNKTNVVRNSGLNNYTIGPYLEVLTKSGLLDPPLNGTHLFYKTTADGRDTLNDLNSVYVYEKLTYLSGEIVSIVLEKCRTDEIKTHLVYATGLNFQTVKPYIKYLSEAGLLEMKDGAHRTYLTTERGTTVNESLKRAYGSFKINEAIQKDRLGSKKRR